MSNNYPLIQIENVSANYGKTNVLNGVNLSYNSTGFSCLLGQNGSGKTSLFRVITGLLKPSAGKILYKGIDIKEQNNFKLAKVIAVMPQFFELPFGFTVEEFVLMGRTPHWKSMFSPSKNDIDIAYEKIKICGIGNIAKRKVNELSGGEKQKTALAQTLAQEPEIMFLDEPTAHLDIKYQLEILRLLSELSKKISIVAAVHDINIASTYCQTTAVLKNGSLIACGNTQEVIASGAISNAFDVCVRTEKNPFTGKVNIFID
ncbi:MAG: ABC transporter ATP-binding protein [Endomicrobiales bacterium]|nr:ABC transporter ATP-binding protein [Endomicrobiales bacterium]